MNNIGTIRTTIAAFTPSALVAIEKLKLAADDYAKSPFSLDRRSKYNNKYGKNAIAIMRRFSEAYPEFLRNKFFGFSFGDESVMNPNQKKYVGLSISENQQGIFDTEAAAVFIQTLLRIFDMEETVFLTPLRKVEFRGGYFAVTEVVSITSKRILNKDILEFVKEEVAKMDQRLKVKK